MKLISRFLNTIAGIFRIFVTLAFLWGIVFTFFVDRNLLTAFYDLLGFDSVSPEIIKIITAIIFAFAFFVNLIVTRFIFNANKTGSHHMSNIFFGFIFLMIDLGIYFFTRDENFLYLLIFSVILILGSLFGLAAKAKGLYSNQDITNEDKLSDPELLNEDATSVEIKASEEVKEEIDDENILAEETKIEEDKETLEQTEDSKIEEDNLETEKVELLEESSKPNNEKSNNDTDNVSEVLNKEEKESKEETYDSDSPQVSIDTKEVNIKEENSTKTENKKEISEENQE